MLGPCWVPSGRAHHPLAEDVLLGDEHNPVGGEPTLETQHDQRQHAVAGANGRSPIVGNFDGGDTVIG